MTTFRIKVKSKTVKGQTTDTFYIQRKVYGLFWTRAQKKDVSLEESVSYPDWIASFSSIEDAKKGVENWKINLSKRVKKVKVGKPVTI